MLAAALSSPPQAIHLHPNLCPPSLCPCPTQLSRRLPPRSEKKCWLRKMRRALQHDDSPWLAALLPGALDIPVPLSHVLMGACSVGATSCSRLLIEAKADIYEQIPPGHLGEGDTALNVALKTLGTWQSALEKQGYAFNLGVAWRGSVKPLGVLLRLLSTT